MPEYLSPGDILQRAKQISADFQRQDLTLTLRQMYYQFVARGLIESGQKAYDRIGKVLTDARYDGSFPIDGLIDRGRDVYGGDFTRCDISIMDARNNVGDSIRALPEQHVRTARWYNQPVFVSVWVEKQALEGVIQPVCDRLGVSWFACKGYPSVSALWDWIKIAKYATSEVVGKDASDHRHQGNAARAVILYLGDHDPDGWEIPRSAERNLKTLMRTYGKRVDVEFKRIALNMDQITQYNPPPFDAKVTSSRYKKYVEEHDTDEAWELDALDPAVLRTLITDEVNALFDEEIYDYERVLEAERRDMIRDWMREPGVIDDILRSDT